MITVLVSFVVAFIIAKILYKKGLDGMSTFLGFVFFATIGVGVAFGIGSTLPTERVVIQKSTLHNLYDDSRVQGGFFLGTGTIKEGDYIFYNVIENGLIKPAKIDKYTSNMFIQEDGAEDPQLETSMMKFTNLSSWLWGLADADVKIIFHIPVGSVDTNFSVK